MSDQFISEPIRPVMASMDTSRMAAGEPGLPREFIWRGKTIIVGEVLRHWKETGPCRHGSNEVYLRKHWYEIRDASGTVMKIYFLKPAKGTLKDSGWRLFSRQK
jgi:phosphoribosylglycinamide formyltransferase-1